MGKRSVLHVPQVYLVGLCTWLSVPRSLQGYAFNSLDAKENCARFLCPFSFDKSIYCLLHRSSPIVQTLRTLENAIAISLMFQLLGVTAINFGVFRSVILFTNFKASVSICWMNEKKPMDISRKITHLGRHYGEMVQVTAQEVYNPSQNAWFQSCPP